MVVTGSERRVFDALAHLYRRQLLFALFEANPQDGDDLNVRDLLEGETMNDLAAPRLELRHVHLPKLAAIGFIEWDPESGKFSRGPKWDEIVPILQLMDDNRGELPREWISGISSPK